MSEYSSAPFSLDAAKAAGWRPDQHIEALRRLRDSDRRVEDRQTYERVARGGRRLSVGIYEESLRAHLRTGGELPTGVTPPPPARENRKAT